MRVAVQADRSYPTPSGPPALLLVPDSWDDYHYTTTYDLWIRTQFMFKNIGMIKVGRLGLGERERPLVGGSVFNDGLPSEYFSLGQDDSYYETIRDFGTDYGDSFRDDIFESLQDVAYSESAFEISSGQQVSGVSLFRSINRRTVIHQYRRIAHGGVRLSDFSFRYKYPSGGSLLASPELTFTVDHESNPPTNVHVIIGRNSVGKTTLLQGLARALREPDNRSFGEIEDMVDGNTVDFVNLVSVSFSAFDPFEYREVFHSGLDGIGFSYVGLRSNFEPASTFGTDEDEGGARTLRDSDELAKEFADSLQRIFSLGRHQRWRRAVSLLENDPNFAEYAVTSLLDRTVDKFRNEEEMWTDREVARRLFDGMSSGHKIVLLTMTRLVEVVVERSLVLLDEPESHLHPPLLSAFIRALSELLIDRNGVAIIATHSPVVLQEVPKRCVWKLRRSGGILIAERPEYETFGESIGALTHDIFGLEVTGSGFHREITEAVKRFNNYGQIMSHFGGQLGSEGKAMVRILLASRDGGSN